MLVILLRVTLELHYTIVENRELLTIVYLHTADSPISIWKRAHMRSGRFLDRTVPR
jgi:hypothetical protein